ncbi:MAG: hypothetical protein ABJC89_05250 [Acidobacteriota bacterium]
MTIRVFRLAIMALILVYSAAPARAQAPDARIPFVLEADRPLRVALDHRIFVRRVGQPVTGTLIEAVYVYDRVVLPVGTRVSGHVVELRPRDRRKHLLALLTGDFSPHRVVTLTFDSASAAGGPAIALDTAVTGGIERLRQSVAHSVWYASGRAFSCRSR